MRNKMITLCPTSYELSKKMPNFSAWVRQMVLENGQKTGKDQEGSSNVSTAHVELMSWLTGKSLQTELTHGLDTVLYATMTLFGGLVND